MIEIGEYKIGLVRDSKMYTNCYFLLKGQDAVLIDAGGDGNKIDNFVKINSLNLLATFITHGHFDHIEALECLHNKFSDMRIYACIDEKVIIENKSNNLMECDLDLEVRNSINYVADQSIINEIGLNFEMIKTPGHTIGSCCYFVQQLNVLFSGDTLFRDTHGRTDLPTGDLKKIVESIKTRLFTLGDDVKVYPGHGLATDIGYEKKYNDLIEYKDYFI